MPAFPNLFDEDDYRNNVFDSESQEEPDEDWFDDDDGDFEDDDPEDFEDDEQEGE